MKFIKAFPLLIFTLLTTFSFSQLPAKNSNFHKEKKTLKTIKTTSPIKIDGVLNEPIWSELEVAKDFIMLRPSSGTVEPENQKSEVKVTYDDNAIYFGAYLYDDKPDEIPKQFANRDNFGSCDWFAIIINPNNDSQNDTEFFIQITGNQADAKASVFNEDFSWSAVWESKVRIVSDGWIVEVRIPYAALRFSNQEVQTWGLNFHRHFNKTRDQYTWNFVDRTIGIIQQYAGILTGIENIKPPTRLSFSPYASATYNSYKGENNLDKSIGLDVKYGISESFTLDATLIPDFGQTAFDNLVLNLGPFEQQYQEQRPFFTEGTELFGKGNMFYSRRVGNTPINYFNENTLNSDEVLIENPDKVNMLNAFKVSGRTKGGLGIGLFNAITEETKATIKNINTDEIRQVVTEPFANYNVLVIDQQFNKNSSISFVNTNVLRQGNVRDANVSGLLYTLVNKKNTHYIDGGIKTSMINNQGVKTNGYFFETNIGKFAGNIQYELEYKFVDKNFNINDLGYQSRNNYQDIEGNISYRIFEPTKNFKEYRVNLWGELNYRHSDGAYMGNSLGINVFTTTLKQFSFGGNISGKIGNSYDYYEPRVENRFYKDNPRINFNAFMSSDYSKKLAIDSRIYYGTRIGENRNYTEFSFSPKYRINDRFAINYSFNFGKGDNEKGRVHKMEDESIIFGIRDTKTITNSISGKYNFGVKSGISLTFRHYWSPIKYESQYYSLNNNGTLSPNSYTNNHDINFNTWNLDLSYSWEFAPGSQLVALYRNAIFNQDNQSQLNFNENLKNLFDESIQNTLSLKIIYYLDYNQLKSWL